MIIDSHFHLWRLSRGDYGWITPELPPLFRDFTDSDWQHARSMEVRAGVLVQCAPTVEETDYLLSIARERDDIIGVVGWVDLNDPGASSTLKRFACEKKLIGIRPMLQDIEDGEWILREQVIENLSLAADLGLCFDALILPHQLGVLAELCRKIPTLKIVIDHGAKPLIKQCQLEPWFSDMQVLAQFPQVFCKLSGLLTEAKVHCTVDDLKPYAQALITLFGPERLLWGSDWPVLTMAADYDDWLKLSRELLTALKPEQQQKIFCSNAVEFYGLDVATLEQQRL